MSKVHSGTRAHSASAASTSARKRRPKAASASRPWPSAAAASSAMRRGGRASASATRASSAEAWNVKGSGMGLRLEASAGLPGTPPRSGSRAALRGPDGPGPDGPGPGGPGPTLEPRGARRVQAGGGQLCRCWDSMARLSPLGGGGGEDPKVVRADRDRVASFDPAAQRGVGGEAAQPQRLHVGGGTQLDRDGRCLECSHVRGREVQRVAW